MARIRRVITHTVLLTFLFGVPLWLLGTVFGVMLGKNHIAKRKPAIRYVIFDLGNVLIKTNQAAMLCKIGLIRTLVYIATLHNPKKLSAKLMETMNLACSIENEALNARTPDGTKPLPQLFRNWLSGKTSSSETLKKTTSFVDAHPELFADRAEQNLIKIGAKLAFTPKILAKASRPVKEAIKFIQECREQGLEVLILSNFDTQTYEQMKTRYPELFDLFDEENIFISGQLGLIKPDPRIYETVLAARNLDPRACVFFDDQQENVESAQACGINAILCPQKKKLLCSEPNINQLRLQLATLIAEHSEQPVDQQQTIQA